MSLQPSASKTDLLIGCARPFSPDLEVERGEAGEAAVYGTDWHKCMSEYVLHGDIPPVFEADLKMHVMRAWACLSKWLSGDNVWKERFTIEGVEQSLAIHIRHAKHPRGVSVRDVQLDEETHTYVGLKKHEIGGTYDLLLRSDSGRIVVLDHKTGDYGDFNSPSSLPQMRTLALATGASGVAILHSPRNAPIIIYAEDVLPETLQRHARELRRALRRIGDGSMRPGKYCKYCPARNGCPAKDAELLVRASSIVRSVTGAPLAAPVDKGAFHLFLSELSMLEKRARAELKNDVLNGEFIQRPDGRVLQIVTKSYETLSKSSILRALGASKGAAMLEKLRKLGALEVSERDELHAVGEK